MSSSHTLRNRKALRRVSTKPRPAFDPLLEKAAEQRGLEVGMAVQEVDTKAPLGSISAISERGIHIPGRKPVHPSRVEPVPKKK